MNELMIFDNPEFGKIRATEIDGEPWLVGKDVAAALGYKDTVNALKAHVDDEDKRGWRITTPSGKQEMTVINESGMYSLILSSKLPIAKQFKRWVTSKILPSIRKTGGYRQTTELETRVAALEEANRELMAALGCAAPVSAWSKAELSHMMAHALELGREDFITVLYLGHYAGLTPFECFTMETAAAAQAVEDGALRVRGRGMVPLNCVVIQRLLRHLRLDSPGRRLLLPDRRRPSAAVDAFQAFLRRYWPLSQDKTPLAARTNAACLMWASPV